MSTTLRAAVAAVLVLAGAGTLAACTPTPPPCLGFAPTIVGTAGGDVLRGTAGPDVIHGLGGNDTISGLGGDDRVCGGAGADTLSAGDGGDSLDGGPGRDAIAGGPGSDVVSYRDDAAGVVVDLKAGRGPESETIKEVEHLVGSRHADWLIGNDAANFIFGLGGDDVLLGRGGADHLSELESVSGETNHIYGGPGNDHIRGHIGREIVAYDMTGVPPLVADLEAGSVSGEGTDALHGVDGIIGSPGADVLRGSTRGELIFGSGGNDRIDGRNGNDTIDGGAGRDEVGFTSSPTGIRADLAAERAIGDGSSIIRHVEDLHGSDHDDLLAGTSGPNAIDGGEGRDTCQGAGGADTLTGCE